MVKMFRKSLKYYKNSSKRLKYATRTLHKTKYQQVGSKPPQALLDYCMQFDEDENI